MKTCKHPKTSKPIGVQVLGEKKLVLVNCLECNSTIVDRTPEQEFLEFLKREMRKDKMKVIA